MIYYFAIGFSIIFIIFILNLVRKNKLDEKYSILWLFFGTVILIVSIFPKLIEKISEWFGVYYPPALMLLFAVLIICAYIVHITMVITKQNKMIIKLTQELAIFKEQNARETNKREEE